MLKLRGLHYITHINNLSSILERGILCHRRIEDDIMKTYLLKKRYNNEGCFPKDPPLVERKGGRYGEFKTNQKV